LGQIRHAQRQGARLTDIVKDHDGAAYGPAAIVDRRSGVFDGELGAIATDQNAVRSESDRFVFLNGPHHRIRNWLTRRTIDDVKDLFSAAARCVLP
jgi:hypothetical protein